MLDTFACPVCGSHDRSVLETFLYRRTDRPGGRALPFLRLWLRARTVGRMLLYARPAKKPVTCRTLSRYQHLRRRVLFDLWFPAADKVALTSFCCEKCGFVAYSPRPAEEDVSAKYAYLKRVEPDIGGQSGYDPRALRADRMRAARVYDRCRPHLPSSVPLRVLDYGGGNGKLLEPFLAQGHSCSLIDYNDHPIEGVTKICDDRSTFSGNGLFDLVLCSHVLEHVSDIAALMAFLRGRTRASGLVYAEVPQEIWAGLRLEADPVTHINFFTQGSLSHLVSAARFEVLESRQEVTTYGGATLEVIWLVAQPIEQGEKPTKPSAEASARGWRQDPRDPIKARIPADAKTRLYPSRRATLHRIYRLSLRPRLSRLLPEVRKRT